MAEMCISRLFRRAEITGFRSVNFQQRIVEYALSSVSLRRPISVMLRSGSMLTVSALPRTPHPYTVETVVEHYAVPIGQN